MPHYCMITGERCYLSPPSLDDAERWAAWENDPAVAIPLGDEAYRPSSPIKMAEWIEEALERRQPLFTIVDAADERPIGRCLLFNVSHVDRSAWAGILIGEQEYWDQGYGTEAMRLLLSYAFGLLNLHNVMLGTFAFNARAIRCYEKVGFHEIGRRRQARIIGGRAYDVVLMDILAGEFDDVYTRRHMPENGGQPV